MSMVVYIVEKGTNETLRMFDTPSDFVPSIGDTLKFVDMEGRYLKTKIVDREIGIGVDMDDCPCFDPIELYVEIINV